MLIPADSTLPGYKECLFFCYKSGAYALVSTLYWLQHLFSTYPDPVYLLPLYLLQHLVYQLLHYINMSIAVARPTIRSFSAHRPQQATRTSRFVARSCLVSAVVLPFVPPALESSREKSMFIATLIRDIMGDEIVANCVDRPSSSLDFHAHEVI